MLVVFCCMAISCFSTGDYTTDAGPDPSREGTTVCAHPNDGHIYLVGNKTCYIVLPASHFEHLCPMGYQCRGAGGFFMQDAAVKTCGGVLHAGCCCQNLGSCVFFFPFWGRLYCVLDTRHESFVMFFVMFSGFCLSVQLTPPISSDVLVRSSSLQRPRKHMQLSYSIVPAEKCQGINAA